MPNRLTNRLKFEVERFLIRGPWHRLLVVALFVGLISLLGGLVALDLTGGFTGPAEAIWWAFLRLTDPGYLGDDEGTLRRVVSTLLTVLGYVVFLGALVAVMTQWLNARLADLQRGLTPIAQSNHVLVLGWTSRTPTIVRELLASEGRVERFLALRGARRLRVVLLVDETTPELVQELRERLGHELWDPRAIIFRSGSPMRLDHLRRVDYRHAAAIIVPTADPDPTRDTLLSRDARTVKVLLSAGAVEPDENEDDTPLPLLVAELVSESTAGTARRAYAGALELVASDVVAARLIVETMRSPGLTHVYSELFTHDTGNELYVRGADAWAGERWARARFACARGIPLGVVRREGDAFVPLLAPPDDLVLRDDDRFVMLAPRFADAQPLAPRAVPAAAERAAAAGEGTAPAAPACLVARRRRVLILGWSHKVAALLHELAAGEERVECAILSLRPVEERRQALARAGVDETRVAVVHHLGDYTRQADVAALEPAAFDNVALVAIERFDDESESDARAILGYLVLQEALHDAPRRPPVVVELLDPENVRLVPLGTNEAIVSPLVLGHMLTQVALRRELRTVFDELFGPGQAELRFAPAAAYGCVGRPATFRDLAVAAARAGEVAVGVRRAGGGNGVHLNPGWDSRWTLAADDALIVVARGG